MKKISKIFASCLTVVCTLIMSFVTVASKNTPDNYKSTDGLDVHLNYYLPLSTKKIYKNSCLNVTSSKIIHNSSNCADLMSLGPIPIKIVNIDSIENLQVMISGMPFGVKMFTKGVVVIGISSVNTENGIVSPASESGIKEGDIILEANDEAINSNEDFVNVIQNAGGSGIKLSILRDNDIRIETILKPVKCFEDNSYKIGIWIRDSAAGIGCLTFYNPTSGEFAGLGHGICDVDTGELMPLMKGEILKANISGIVKAEKGFPGELKGYFSDSEPIGTLTNNRNTGIYGVLKNPPANNEIVSVAMKQQVKLGSAKIFTTVCGEKPEYFDIEIINVNYKESCPTKNMVIKIVDKRLLDLTGGIVQGMSGSPIIQDQKLVGAVTHVFVNEPAKGYGIFIENMLECNNKTT